MKIGESVAEIIDDLLKEKKHVVVQASRDDYKKSGRSTTTQTLWVSMKLVLFMFLNDLINTITQHKKTQCFQV